MVEVEARPTSLRAQRAQHGAGHERDRNLSACRADETLNVNNEKAGETPSDCVDEYFWLLCWLFVGQKSRTTIGCVGVEYVRYRSSHATMGGVCLVCFVLCTHSTRTPSQS